MPISIQLPDLLADWPFEACMNPSFGDATDCSITWALDYLPTPKLQAGFKKIKVDTLVARSYPSLRPEHLRTACDLVGMLFFMDDWSDKLSATELDTIIPRVLDILKNPREKVTDQSAIALQMNQSFWSRASKIASPLCISRFIKSYEYHLNGLRIQAAARDNNTILSVNEYINVRRMTAAVPPCLEMLLLSVTSLTEELLDHPVVQELREIVVDLIGFANDVCSYNIEQARGDDAHNLVTVLMAERKMSLQAAFDTVGTIYSRLKTRFIELLDDLPQCSDQTQQLELEQYVLGIANCVTANIVFDFESERYFGKGGAIVRATRMMELLPKRR